MFGGSLLRIRRTHVGGGGTRAIRRKGVISADTAEVPAATKCHFSGREGASRQTIRRIILQLVQFSHHMKLE